MKGMIIQTMELLEYDDSVHRLQVIDIWKNVFGYRDARNDPAFLIDTKTVMNDHLFFVAFSENRVIGTVMAGYDGHRGWIYSLAVIPEKRHQTAGSSLLKHAEQALEKLGCSKINLQLLQSNEAVKGFYIKNGYKVEERISMGKEIRENIPPSE